MIIDLIAAVEFLIADSSRVFALQCGSFTCTLLSFDLCLTLSLAHFFGKSFCLGDLFLGVHYLIENDLLDKGNDIGQEPVNTYACGNYKGDVYAE